MKQFLFKATVACAATLMASGSAFALSCFVPAETVEAELASTNGEPMAEGDMRIEADWDAVRFTVEHPDGTWSILRFEAAFDSEVAP